MSSSEPVLRVEALSAAWEGDEVLHEVTFEVRAGELVVLMGPNGSGKTTLLRCLAGLEAPTHGRVSLAGEEITRRPAHRRGIALMFQDPALFPHRTVYENVAYAPLLQRRPRSEVAREVDDLVRRLGLAGLEDRRPDRLSGGERQRVALARTLAARPQVILLDEPFAALDAELKAELRAEFREVLRERAATAIHVTHDRAEGLFLGDRAALLFDGRLSPLVPPTDLFGRPADARAARFLGYNVVRGAGSEIAVHPDEVTLGPPGSGARDGTVLARGPTGRTGLAVVRLDDGTRLEVAVAAGTVAPDPGTRVGLAWGRTLPLPGGPLAAEPKSPRTSGG